MGVSIIVACDPNGVIGKEGKLPWRIKEDLILFRKRTLGHAIIMGRKTWASLPKKPLDGRANVVISRSNWAAPSDIELGPHFYGGLGGAIYAIRNWDGILAKYATNDIYIIGGAEIYKTALENNIVDRIIMSRTNGAYDGDVRFPKLPEEQDWVTTATEYRTGFDVVYFSKKDKLPF